MNEQTPLSPLRLTINQIAVTWGIGSAAFLSRHWLFAVNGVMASITALSMAAPWLMAIGQSWAADAVYRLYASICHQLPFRSYFLFGYQMAYCQRNFAIFLSLLLAGLVFAALRRRMRPIDWRLYLVLIAPMAVDGFTQLFGWRESNWELRTVTGTLFGVASVWFLYPHIDVGMAELSRELSEIERPA
ncbi:MAG: DUF2085 domain-containing protein [Chloroflexota bacterium]|nr:MAG: DUF2085 domain-containing protein [Chloroflexota bacterium]